MAKNGTFSLDSLGVGERQGLIAVQVQKLGELTKELQTLFKDNGCESFENAFAQSKSNVLSEAFFKKRDELVEEIGKTASLITELSAV